MEVIVGFYAFITKLHFIELKEKLKKEGYKLEYFRSDFDYLLIQTKLGTVKISQDGLIYLRSKGNISKIDAIFKWLDDNIFKHMKEISDENHLYFLNLILKSKPSIILLNPEGKTNSIYKKLGKKQDYTLKTKKIHKTYGEGLAVFDKIKYTKKQLDQLIEYQLIFSEYQNLVQHILDHNKKVMQDMTELRHKEAIRFKELPVTINYLIDKRRETTVILKKIIQLDDFLTQRGEKCEIKKILKEIKMLDFREMVRLNNYLRDDFELTRSYIESTIELSDFTLRENEQKEINILQVIFAIGTIAAIVSLGAMPGAKLFFKVIGDTIVGEMVSFSLSDLMFWTLISVVIGLVLFILMNFIFQHVKRLRMIKIVKKKN